MKSLFITEEAYRKMFAYADLMDPKEVLFLLQIAEATGPEGGLIVEDIILPKQTVSGGSCDLLIDKTITELEHPEKIKGWGHSHVHMGTFHSGIDDKTLEDWGGGMTMFSVSVVVSLPNEIKAWIQYFKPVEIKKVEIPVVVLWNDDEDLYKKCQKQLDEKISEKVYSWVKPGGGKKNQIVVEGGDDGQEEPKSPDKKGIQTSIEDGKPIIQQLGTVDPTGCLHKMYNRKKKPYCHIHGKLRCDDCNRDTRKNYGKKTVDTMVIHEDCDLYGGEDGLYYLCAHYGVILSGCEDCPMGPVTSSKAKIVEKKWVD